MRAMLVGLLVGVLLVCTMASAQQQTQPIVPSGDFETLTASGQPPGWPALPANIRVEQIDANNHVLRVEAVSSVELKLPIRPEWKRLLISARLKIAALRLGNESWQNARVMVRFDQTMEGGQQWYADSPNLSADSDWVTQQVIVEVPQGASVLTLAPSVFGPAGVLWVDDLEVRPATDAELRRLKIEAFGKTLVPLAPDGSLPYGTFEQIGAAGRPVGWSGFESAPSASIATDGANHWLKIQLDQPGWQTVRCAFAFPESWQALKLTARVRAKVTQLGQENWQTPRIQCLALDETGEHLGGWPVIESRTDHDWRQMQTIVERPAGATAARIEVAIMNAAGTYEVDDLRIEPMGAGGLPLALPVDLQPAWGKEPVEQLTTVREQIVLNGLWQFMPAVGPAAATPDAAWGWTWVPGSWRKTDRLPWLAAGGASDAWRDFDGEQLARAWYQRTIHVPAGWIGGRSILLDFNRICTDAVVYVNDQEVGRIEWPAGVVDISKAVHAGDNTLRVLVVAVQDKAESVVLMGVGAGQVEKAKAQLETRGITGDVVLRCEPAGPRITDVFVQTSVRQKQVTLDVELTGVKQAGVVDLTARMLDEKGQEEIRFSGKANVAAADVQRVKLTFPWPNPRLWDMEQPNLYTLRLEASGAGVQDDYAQTFGFREIWIGSDDPQQPQRELAQGQVPQRLRFYLNGTEIRFRPVCLDESWELRRGDRESFEGWIDGARWAGFNIGEVWPLDKTERGWPDARPLWYDIADRKGFALMGVAPASLPFILDKSNWSCVWEKNKEAFARFADAELRKIRNHPSILLYTSNANFFGHNQDQNPRYIGRRGWTIDQDPRRRQFIDGGLESMAVIKQLDPTRPYFAHMGGQDFGDISATNHYLCFHPLQEREEWMSYWAQHGDMPYLAIEFGTPLNCSFMRGHAHGGWGAPEPGGAMTSEPLVTEFSAIYLGAKAYTQELEAYRPYIRERFIKDQLYDSTHGRPLLETAPDIQDVEQLFVLNTWRSFRTMGLTGGLVPWTLAHGWAYPLRQDQHRMVKLPPFQPGRRGPYFPELPEHELHRFVERGGTTLLPAGHTLVSVNRATLAWIAGPEQGSYPLTEIPAGLNAPAAEPAPAWTLKDHNFRPGQRVSKQAVLINDTRSRQPYQMHWSVQIAGKAIAQGEGSGQIEPGSTLFLPVQFDTPEQLGGLKADGVIQLAATIGSARHEDRFPFRVFAPAAKVQTKEPWFIFDSPAGHTSKLLASLGLATQPWTGQQTTSAPLVIGRQALSGGAALPGDLEAFVRAGGHVLMMAQDPQWMRDYLGLRINQQVTRRVFPMDAQHPIIAGLDAEDLRDWTGDGTLVAPYPETEDLTKEAPNGWRWGNRGSVSSAAVEKPHHSSWRPILECEFDLAYSPLMELDHGKGRLILCTLDLDGRTASDPAAEVLASRILTYLSTQAPQAKPFRTIYLGDPTGEQMLNALGVIYEKAAGPGGPRPLLVAGAGADPKVVQAFARDGGTVVVLAQRNDSPLAPVQLLKDTYPAFDVPAWDIARGLGVSDLHWRVPADAWLLKTAPGVELAAGGQLGLQRVGTGRIIYCQLDPGRYNADVQTYHRFTRWRQTRALAQVLANAGAAFRMDERIFHPVPPKRDQVDLAGQWQAGIMRALPSVGQGAGVHPETGITDEARAAIALGVDAALPPGWQQVKVPAMWETWGGDWAGLDGEVIFRRIVEISPQLAGQELELRLGALDDFDDTFWDAQPVGRTDMNTPAFYSVPRVYKLTPTQTAAGRHVLTVRIFDHFGGGGFNSSPADMVLAKPRSTTLGFYHPDYRDDHDLGDDPARYKRW